MDSEPGDTRALKSCGVGQLLLYFLKLGALGFGGPIALTGAMQRDLVDRERWITLQEYKEGLALSQLAPGPLAAQLAIYLGWTRFGILGATLVAFAFILPSLFMVLGLAALYLRLWRSCLDARRLLRCGRRGDCDHRQKRLEAVKEHTWLEAPLVAPVPGDGRRDRVDGAGRTPDRVIGAVTGVVSAAGQISVKTDRGDVVTVVASGSTVFRKVPPGAQDLAAATRIDGWTTSRLQRAPKSIAQLGGGASLPSRPGKRFEFSALNAPRGPQPILRFVTHNGSMKLSIATGILLCLGVAAPLPAALTEAQRTAIDQATGAKGVYTASEDTYKVSFPRNDVKVAVEGRPLAPFLGLTSWAAFTPGAHGGLLVMGDIVLLEDEVNPAMSAALDAGLEVTALHNHFFYESPRVMFMHIGGSGSAEQLAAGVRKVLDAVKSVRSASPTPATSFPGEPLPDKSSITASAVDAILGVKGESNKGMYKATIGRTASMHGTKVGKQMGVNTWAALAGSDENALVDGDFAMTTEELQGVLKALRKADINIVAIHNHMTHEQPQYVFLHYWGKGPAAALAQGLKSALDTQKQ